MMEKLQSSFFASKCVGGALALALAVVSGCATSQAVGEEEVLSELEPAVEPQPDRADFAGAGDLALDPEHVADGGVELSDSSQHIPELGGENLLDETVEEEVEATSVDDTEVVEEPATENEIPVVINERVQWWIDYFTGRGRARFQRHLDRADMYLPIVRPVLNEHGVPEDLHYLALIESGFVTSARSRAGAQGIWQFIRATGRRYGLAVNRVVDERRDPVRSTHAAAQYLTDLHNIFNNWYLAMAAYNCGEYRVVRAIFKGRSRDFWELSEKKMLPKETRHYVPKYLAAVIIAKNREQYGFVANDVEALPEVAGVEVPTALRLRDVAKIAEIDRSVLKKLNPHLLMNRIPATGKGYTLWVPADRVEAVATIQDQLHDQRKKNLKEGIVAQGVEWHRVRRGESLYTIAKRYGMTVRQLKRLNNLGSNRIHPGKKLVLSRSTGGVAKSRSSGRPATETHVVRRGESLYKIANAYGMSVSELKKVNKLRSSRIYPGKRLKVAGAAPIAEKKVAAATSSASKQSEYVFYRVKNGDSLYKIARKFKSSARTLKRLNDLNSNLIRKGDLIRVPAIN